MPFLLEFRPYQRKFTCPLQTVHGLWQTRPGILVRITDELEQVGYGEITPVLWFGSESDEQAWSFCQSWQGKLIDNNQLQQISPRLPACQFGIAVARENLEAEPPASQAEFADLPQSVLLPTGEEALDSWRSPYIQGDRTFKWKIGVAPLPEELDHCKTLLELLPPDSQLRLDANGGLTLREAEAWLSLCDAHFPKVEFLEQPLAIAQFDTMQSLSRDYATPLALDESVATLAQLQDCYQRGWRGVFVIKPAIAGSPSQLRQFCQQHDLDVVCSSVFETIIGRRAGLRLAAELSHRAAGYGVSHWFADGWDQETCTPEFLWQNC